MQKILFIFLCLFQTLHAGSFFIPNSLSNYVIYAENVHDARKANCILRIDELLKEQRILRCRSYIPEEVLDESIILELKSLDGKRPKPLSEDLLNQLSDRFNFDRSFITDSAGSIIVQGSDLSGHYSIPLILEVDDIVQSEIAKLYSILLCKFLHFSSYMIPITVYDKNGFCTQHRIVTFSRMKDKFFGLSNSNFSESFPEVSKFKKIDFSKTLVYRMNSCY